MHAAETPRRRSARHWVLLIPILAAVAWLHAPALDLPLFADDYLFLDQVRDRSLPETLASGDPLGNFFRPVGRQIHFWWVAHASNESPAAFHAANIAAFMLIVGLLFAIALRLAGLGAAAFAAAFVGLHYSADIAIRWGSGSQDLLAVVGALLALLLYLRGWRWPAAASLLLGLLSKETVALTPLIAVVLARREGESWRDALRRSWPLFLAVAIWAVAWLSTSDRLAGAERTVELNPWGVPAALAHLVQVAIGLEWPPGGAPSWPPPPPLVPLALAAVVLWFSIRKGGGSEEPAATPPHTGLAWATFAALPVAAVASIWSAYYYLFAMCGVGLWLGTVLARRHAVVGVVLLALLAWGSQSGRHLAEFSTAPNAWSTQSHVNRFYMDRSMRFVSRYLADMKRLRPTLPERSTIFFSGLPAYVALQTADGPVVRWAYRDSSLRSYWLVDFSLDKFERGPVFSMAASLDSLTENPLGPEAWPRLGISFLLDGRTDSALDAFRLSVRENPGQDVHRYRLGMVLAALGDTSGYADLRAAGARVDAGPAPHTERAVRLIGAADTTRAWQTAIAGIEAHALDPAVHALLADIALTANRSEEIGYFESWVAVHLAPGDAWNWRRWGLVLVVTNRHQQAVESLDRYLGLAGDEARGDAAVQRWLETTRPRLPGGARAGEELRRLPGSR